MVYGHDCAKVPKPPRHPHPGSSPEEAHSSCKLLKAHPPAGACVPPHQPANGMAGRAHNSQPGVCASSSDEGRTCTIVDARRACRRARRPLKHPRSRRKANWFTNLSYGNWASSPAAGDWASCGFWRCVAAALPQPAQHHYRSMGAGSLERLSETDCAILCNSERVIGKVLNRPGPFSPDPCLFPENPQQFCNSMGAY
jgi:hypothetical protein